MKTAMVDRGAFWRGFRVNTYFVAYHLRYDDTWRERDTALQNALREAGARRVDLPFLSIIETEDDIETLRARLTPDNFDHARDKVLIINARVRGAATIGKFMSGVAVP